MTDALTPKSRKPRRRVTTDLGRQLMQKERNRLAKEQAMLGEALALEAQAKMARKRRLRAEVKPEHIAVARGIVKRFAGVLASEGVSARITATASDRVSAWTDFDSITINYVHDDNVRMMAATLRGFGYHEGGHIRWTIPFMDLTEEVGLQGRQHAQYHHAWNLLEDQRMETAVVSDSPRKAAYFTTMVMDALCETTQAMTYNWPLLIWRRYLPKHMRVLARKFWVEARNADGLDGEGLARRFENVVTTYVLASRAPVMWQAVLDCHDLLQEVQVGGLDDAAMGHSHQYGYSRKDQQERQRQNADKLSVPVDPTMEGEGESEGDGQPSEGGQPGQGKGQNGQDNGQPGEKGKRKGLGGEGADLPDGEGQTFANEDTGYQHTDEGEGSTSGAHSNTGIPEGMDYDPQTVLDEIREAAQAERNRDRALDGDVRAYAEAKEDHASGQMPYMTGPTSNIEALAQADHLATDLEESFLAATVDKAPGWIEGQRRGIVNVLRYETRRPGDLEFFRNWTDDDQPGFNMAVSVLLDYSGSMSTHTLQLAQAGYAAKKACLGLGIPCTVTLWDTEAVTLWDAEEAPEYLPIIVANGGTDPRVALSDLDNQNRAQKPRHLVIIMTDGEWSGNTNAGMLGAYNAEGRFFLGLPYKCADTMAERMRGYGCHDARAIETLLDIPKVMTEVLETWARD